ncbi:MAG: divalent-cation tolerance protein CutA [Candidatus Omnitrophota bacterium]
MKISLVYITTKDKSEARKIARQLLEARLAGCINIIDNVNSMYWWQGDIQDEQEALLIAKTKESLVEELMEKVKSLHSYSCPCVISLPVLQGNKEYIDWLEKETK